MVVPDSALKRVLRRYVPGISGPERMPRYHPATHMHGYLSRDGTPPRDLLAIARNEVEAYGGTILTDPAADAVYEEMRLPYVGGCLPVCILKAKSADRRFEGTPGFADLGAVEAMRPYFAATADPSVLSSPRSRSSGSTGSQGRWVSIADELDVIRDADSGRLHVIDVTKTPCGPTIVFSSSDMQRSSVHTLTRSMRWYGGSDRSPAVSSALTARRAAGSRLGSAANSDAPPRADVGEGARDERRSHDRESDGNELEATVDGCSPGLGIECSSTAAKCKAPDKRIRRCGATSKRARLRYSGCRAHVRDRRGRPDREL